MYKIYYKSALGHYIIERTECDVPSENLALIFDGEMNAVIRIGNEQAEIRGKRVIFDTGEWQNGIFTPILYIGTRVLALEAFSMKEGAPSELPYSREYTRLLLTSAEETRGKLFEMKSELEGLKRLISGSPIF